IIQFFHTAPSRIEVLTSPPASLLHKAIGSFRTIVMLKARLQPKNLFVHKEDSLLSLRMTVLLYFHTLWVSTSQPWATPLKIELCTSMSFRA
ncbi:MAG TPA: hypothetical protein PLZ29_06890, partial [Spirochaetota bacterium]|nr:hypothetical protein [Spirochaetota bacterium]